MNEPTLYVLDVGHGNSAVLMDDRVIVIDAGPGSTLLEFLRERKVTALSVVLISHADEDHIKGIIGLIESGVVTIDRVHINSDAVKDSATWHDLAYLLDIANTEKKIHFDVGLTTNHSNTFNTASVVVEVVAPSPGLAVKGPGSRDHKGRKLTSNSMSAVIRLLRNGNPLVLLPGDLDETGLDNLIEFGVDIRASVAIFPHHGGGTGDPDVSRFAHTFLNACSPEAVVFSIGRGKYGTPRPEVVAAARAHNSKLRVVCTQLSERCAAVLPRMDPIHLTDIFSKGREDRKCCAGSIILLLASEGARLLPEADAHLKFIDEAAPTALCVKPV